MREVCAEHNMKGNLLNKFFKSRRQKNKVIE